MNTAITAFLEMLKQFFSLRQTSIENQTTTSVVKDKKCLKKASNITEKILLITDNYKEHFDKKDLRKYEKLKKQFLKVN